MMRQHREFLRKRDVNPSQYRVIILLHIFFLRERVVIYTYVWTSVRNTYYFSSTLRTIWRAKFKRIISVKTIHCLFFSIHDISPFSDSGVEIPPTAQDGGVCFHNTLKCIHNFSCTEAGSTWKVKSVQITEHGIEISSSEAEYPVQFIKHR